MNQSKNLNVLQEELTKEEKYVRSYEASLIGANRLANERVVTCWLYQFSGAAWYPFDRWDIVHASKGGFAWATAHKIMYLCIQIY